MFRKSLIPLLVAFLVLCAAPAWAQEQEVVHFTNGSTMTIESHQIEEGMVHVSLGGQSFMAFPLNQIEKIETAQGEVAIPREGVANRIVPTPAGAGVIRGEQPGYKRRGQWEGGVAAQPDESIDVDDKGIAVFRPFASGPPNKRQFGVAGRRELRNQSPSRRSGSGLIGTSRVGAKYALPPKMKGGHTRQPIGLAARASAKTQNDKKKDD